VNIVFVLLQVRLLDDVLKLAKLRSNDPKKYLPLAVNILKDRLKHSGTTRQRKQAVRFAHTLETLLTATNDEPELITTILKKKTEEKKSSISTKYSDEPLTTESDSLKKITKKVNKNIDNSPIESLSSANVPSYPSRMSTTDRHRQTLPIIDEAVQPKVPSSNVPAIDSKLYPKDLVSIPSISDIGLTVAQLVVLATVHNQAPLKLANTQIEQ
jgi:hypothetical protein